MSNQSGNFDTGNFKKIYTPSPKNPIFIYALITLILVVVALALYIVFGHYSTGFLTFLANVIGIIIAYIILGLIWALFWFVFSESTSTTIMWILVILLLLLHALAIVGHSIKILLPE